MKAILLAAGLGTRLRPLTDTIPKCLVEINDRPLLEIWIRHLADAGIQEILINTHYHADAVEKFIERLSMLGLPRLVTSYEPTLLGSAGTLKKNIEFLGGASSVFVANADTLTNFPIQRLLTAHENNTCAATIGVYHAPNPTEVGILELDKKGIVRSFDEKPTNPKSDLANGGLYVFSRDVIEDIGESCPADIGFDLLPRLVGRAQGVNVGNYVLHDIGNLAALSDAQEIWHNRGNK